MGFQPVKPGSAVPAEGCIDNLDRVIVYAPIPCAAVDAGGKICWCNNAFGEMIGYTRGELEHVDLLADIVSPEWREPAAKAIESGQPKGCTGQLTLELIRKDGSRMPACMVTHFIGGTCGNHPFSILLFTQFPETRLAEAAASKRESSMARALRIARIGTWEIDFTTGSFTCSDDALLIAGIRSEFGQLKDWTVLKSSIHPEDRDGVIREFEATLESRGTIHTTFRILRWDNSVRMISVEGETIPGPNGKIAQLFGTIQDITERRRAEDELKVAKAHSELYVDLMGHDINNMNQIAMGYLELADEIIEAHGSLSRDDRFLISRPIDTLRDNSRLIDNVRKIQKSKAGVYKPEEIEIAGLLEGVISRFSEVKGRDVRINLAASCSCRVMANELLKEVFLNLVGNAIKHSTGSLTIDIKAEKREVEGMTRCRVTVEDNGPGIPDDLKKKLFDRLSLEKTRASGKGFGLCLTKMLVDDFNGQFWVEDRVAGDYTRGCRFVVQLPAVEKCGK